MARVKMTEAQLRRPRTPKTRGAKAPDLADELAAQVAHAGLPAPSREHRFCARKWRLDLAWPDRLLCVECDGGTWARGRHSRGKGYERDAVKLNEAALLGWRVLRVTTDMVKDGRALRFVERAIEAFAQQGVF